MLGASFLLGGLKHHVQEYNRVNARFQAGLLLLAQPIVAYLLDVVLLDHPTSPRQWLGLVVSLAGIFVAGMKSRSVTVADEP